MVIFVFYYIFAVIDGAITNVRQSTNLNYFILFPEGDEQEIKQDSETFTSFLSNFYFNVFNFASFLLNMCLTVYLIQLIFIFYYFNFNFLCMTYFNNYEALTCCGLLHFVSILDFKIS